jgi:aspartyl-tRNA(Asn)/glutamyl-tRNA(Gln) amidotransferase subunit C
MSISEQDVRHVASLARLEVADERISTLVSEMNRILDYVGMLQRVEMQPLLDDTTVPDVTTSSLRADIPGSVKLERTISEFAPAERDGFLLVPRLASHA